MINVAVVDNAAFIRHVLVWPRFGTPLKCSLDVARSPAAAVARLVILLDAGLID
jgi:hypothetical protein